MAVRQGMSLIHDDDLREEQGLRIRAVELALTLGNNHTVEDLVAASEKILEFITPKSQGTAESD